MKSPWFPAAGRNSRARARLFCFPHAGAEHLFSERGRRISRIASK